MSVFHRGLLATRIAAPVFAAVMLLVANPSRAQDTQLFRTLGDSSTTDLQPAQSTALDNILKRPTTMSVSVVAADADALRRDTLGIDVPEIGAMTLDGRSSPIENKTFTWTGTLEDPKNVVTGAANFVVDGADIIGTIRRDGELFRVEPLGGGLHALVRVNPEALPPEEPPSLLDRGGRTELPDLPATVKHQDIDVAVFYTPAAKKAYSNINGLIQLAMLETNQSYANSEIKITLTNLATTEFNYDERGKGYETIVDNLSDDSAVKAIRDKVGADLVIMVVDQSQYCGMADAILADANTAFAAVHFDCATGYYSFGHELGHLQGARHDERNDPSTSPFSFGHGYQYTTANPPWRTIMAYNCSPSCTRLPYWSNPNVAYNGLPTGTVITNDNARVLNQTAPIIAGFRVRSTAVTGAAK